MILAGDIGGTKTVLALFEEEGDRLREIASATFPSQKRDTFEEIVDEFLASAECEAPRAACFGVAGVIAEGEAETTNLPWKLTEADLCKRIGARQVKLINDLEAAAYGILHLPASQREILNAGTEPGRKGNIAVIAAGTGLGEAILFWDGKYHHAIASEGGHTDFAPRDEREVELLRYLRTEHGGHVSYERILSGPGFHAVYRFLRDEGYAPEPDWLREKLQKGDPSAAITESALSGEDELCQMTLDLFVSIYGGEAGNLALKCLSRGGVFIGGGIAPKIIPALRTETFMSAFADKGRFGELLRSMEISVALEPRAPLLGAAHTAARL